MLEYRCANRGFGFKTIGFVFGASGGIFQAQNFGEKHSAGLRTWRCKIKSLSKYQELIRVGKETMGTFQDAADVVVLLQAGRTELQDLAAALKKEQRELKAKMKEVEAKEKLQKDKDDELERLRQEVGERQETPKGLQEELDTLRSECKKAREEKQDLEVTASWYAKRRNWLRYHAGKRESHIYDHAKTVLTEDRKYFADLYKQSNDATRNIQTRQDRAHVQVRGRGENGHNAGPRLPAVGSTSGGAGPSRLQRATDPSASPITIDDEDDVSLSLGDWNTKKRKH